MVYWHNYLSSRIFATQVTVGYSSNEKKSLYEDFETQWLDARHLSDGVTLK